MGMDDDALVRFASACAAVAISRYPMQLQPPTLEELFLSQYRDDLTADSTDSAADANPKEQVSA